MSGLNHESTETVGEDTVLDLEVTSNRGDCLGHIGVAREAAVLLRQELKLPATDCAEANERASDCISVNNQFPEGCPQYTARVIRGVKIGPSPAWLKRRLNSIGVASVNNVVDVTNYVMMECGQPLHAFDLAKVNDGKIIVRPATDGEVLTAIDHRDYRLDADMVVIADTQGPIGLGGVMGGADSEVSEDTVDLVIEAASFTPLRIRRAARRLKLHSAASFRFERRPDPEGLDWASERCCHLIQQVAGGKVLSGIVAAGEQPPSRTAVTLRRTQVKRVLGIDVPASETDQILSQLGCQVNASTKGELTVVPPSWRADLTREIDLIEEVARIYGYDKIPEDATVPLSIAAARPRDVVLTRVRQVLSAYGIDEAMTASVVGEAQEKCGSLWANNEPLQIETPLLAGAKLLRRSLLPSLLGARYINQSQASISAQLYEVATVFLPQDDPAALPDQKPLLGIVANGDLRFARGVVEDIAEQVISPEQTIEFCEAKHPMFADGALLRVSIGGSDTPLGYVGLLSATAQKEFDLEHPVACAEICVESLTDALQEVRTTRRVSMFPAINRDLNFVVDEPTRWEQLETICRSASNDLLTGVRYQETYRNAKKDGANKKRILLTLDFQSLDRTLTSSEVDEQVAAIIAACSKQANAQLLA
jgi:phenylalanyl-tRNA synthetase beta chain